MVEFNVFLEKWYENTLIEHPTIKSYMVMMPNKVEEGLVITISSN